MARIIVQSDPDGDRPGAVTWEEHVVPAHLTSDQATAQLMERLGWAILDADAEDRAEPAASRG